MKYIITLLIIFIITIMTFNAFGEKEVIKNISPTNKGFITIEYSLQYKKPKNKR